MKYYFSFFLSLAFTLTQAQSLTQTIRGIITDKISEKPLSGASISIEGTGLSTLSNTVGIFVLTGVPVGRVKLNISFVGYGAVSIPEVLITAGKEVVLDVALEQNRVALSEVVVKGTKTKKGNVSNDYAGSSARSFNIDEINRYAGGRNDPSKLVSNYSGVVSNNDSRNDIVVRGNSPAGVLWRIEGLPSPSPNHYSTLGTTGGPISALNTNALKTSDFYTGAFPAEYGNALAAVFDINLRSGNAAIHERTLQLNLFSGLEAMLEGPLNNNKNGASYLLGYRYSFVQIGQSLGLDVGTEAVPKYQDWVYNIQFGKSKAGKFSLYGMGGISSIDFIGKDIDTTDFYSRKDQDGYVRSNFYLFGAKHTIDLNSKTYLRTSVSYSNTKTDFDNYQYPLPIPPYSTRWLVTQIDDRQNVLRFSTIVNSKSSASFSWRAGITGESYGLKSFLKDREGKPETSPFNINRNFDDNFFLWQYFGQARYKPTDKLSIIAGLHGMHLTFNSTGMLEPRASIAYNVNPKSTLSLSYGLHGQLQPLPVYLYESQNGMLKTNRDLDFTKANHFIAGYENRFATDWRIKAEVYHQRLFDVPVEASPSGFSMLNAGGDFTFPEKAGLVNKGEGTNTGVELTVEKFLSGGFYLLTTGSVFDSKYKGSDGIERNSTYNYGYAANFLGGREWKLGKEGRRVFTFDVRLSTIGGRYATPVDLQASIVAGRELLDERSYNSERLDNYFRLDTKFGFRINAKRRKLSQTIYLDLQNVTNKKNIFLRRFNPLYGTTGNVNQIGFFPDILYRVQF
jgi:hypothetical protein